MPKNEITILSTAVLDASLLEKFSGSAMEFEVIPFIETAPVAQPGLKKAIAPWLGKAASVVFTSGNAVEPVVSCINGDRPRWQIFCLGYNTRKLVNKYFGADAVAGTADSAAGLAEKIAGKKIDPPVIFFCGDQRRQELPDILSASGLEVKEIVTYETKLVPKKIIKRYDGILFFSPSAVQSFFLMNQLQPETILFAIGNTTASALEKNTTNEIIIADKPEKEEVLKKLIEYFNK